MTQVRLRVPVVAIGLAVVALYVFGKFTATQGAESAAIIQSSRNALAAGKAYRAQVAKLRAASRGHVAAAREGTARLVVIAPTMAAPALRIALVAVTRDWELAFRAESTRADVAEARVASLERNLTATLTVADCRMLGVKFLPRCPSRNVAFFVGAGVTAVAFVVTRR